MMRTQDGKRQRKRQRLSEMNDENKEMNGRITKIRPLSVRNAMYAWCDASHPCYWHFPEAYNMDKATSLHESNTSRVPCHRESIAVNSISFSARNNLASNAISSHWVCVSVLCECTENIKNKATIKKAWKAAAMAAAMATTTLQRIKRQNQIGYCTDYIQFSSFRILIMLSFPDYKHHRKRNINIMCRRVFALIHNPCTYLCRPSF